MRKLSNTDAELKKRYLQKSVYYHYETWFFLMLRMKVLNLSFSLTINVRHHIETSQLICRANQLTGFYMMGNIGR